MLQIIELYCKSVQGQAFNTKLQAQVFCNHFPNLNTAFLHECVAAWSQPWARPTTSPRAAPLWLSQWQRPDSWGGCQEAVAFSLRATLQMGAAIKQREGEGKKKDKNIQKLGSIIGCASQPFFMCEHSPVENSRSHLVSQWNSTLSPLVVPSHSVHPSTRLLGAHLTSLFNNTVHWIVTLDYIIISPWFLPICGGGILDYYHLITMLPRCWSRGRVLEAETLTPPLTLTEWQDR